MTNFALIKFKMAASRPFYFLSHYRGNLEYDIGRKVL